MKNNEQFSTEDKEVKSPEEGAWDILDSGSASPMEITRAYETLVGLYKGKDQDKFEATVDAWMREEARVSASRNASGESENMAEHRADSEGPKQKLSKFKKLGYSLATSAGLLGFGLNLDAGAAEPTGGVGSRVVQKTENSNWQKIAKSESKERENKVEKREYEYKYFERDIKDYLGSDGQVLDLGKDGAMVLFVNEGGSKPKIEEKKLSVKDCDRFCFYTTMAGPSCFHREGEGMLKGEVAANFGKRGDLEKKMTDEEIKSAEKTWEEVNKRNVEEVKDGTFVKKHFNYLQPDKYEKSAAHDMNLPVHDDAAEKQKELDELKERSKKDIADVKQNIFFMEEGGTKYIVTRFLHNGKYDYRRATEKLPGEFSEIEKSGFLNDAYLSKLTATTVIRDLGESYDISNTNVEEIKNHLKGKLTKDAVELKNDVFPEDKEYAVRYEHKKSDGEKGWKYVKFSKNILADADRFLGQ